MGILAPAPFLALTLFVLALVPLILRLTLMQMRPENQPQQRPSAGQRPGNRQRREGFLFQPRKRQDKLDKTRLLIRFDANRDGQLSAAERAAAIEAMSQ